MGKRASQGDDHNMGALWVRPDGQVPVSLLQPATMTAPATAITEIATNPNDASAWGPDCFSTGGPLATPIRAGTSRITTLHFLPAEGTSRGCLYNISRESQRSPNLSYSDDHGQTWHYAGKLTLTRSASSYRTVT